MVFCKLNVAFCKLNLLPFSGNRVPEKLLTVQVIVTVASLKPDLKYLCRCFYADMDSS